LLLPGDQLEQAKASIHALLVSHLVAAPPLEAELGWLKKFPDQVQFY